MEPRVSEIVAAVPITAVFVELGGQRPQHGRAARFWCSGDNPHAISLNDEKACWYDFVAGVAVECLI